VGAQPTAGQLIDAPQRSRKRRHVIIATGVRSPSHAESEYDGNEYGGLPVAVWLTVIAL
jgi:hypothetical protein